MRDETVAERLRDYTVRITNSCSEFRKIATGAKNCVGIDCSMCRRQIANALADAIEAEQAEWKAKARAAEDHAAKLEAENRELKETLERALTERNEVDVEKVIILRGLRDLANTSKHHSNAEWKRIVMRLTENAEDYANRVLAEARERTKTEHDGVDVEALLKVADEMADLACVPSYKRASSVDMSYVAKWWRQIASAVKGAAWLKPDTQEDIDADAALSFAEYTRKWPCPIDRADDSAAWHREHLLARQRKLLGGESYE